MEVYEHAGRNYWPFVLKNKPKPSWSQISLCDSQHKASVNSCAGNGHCLVPSQISLAVLYLPRSKYF